MEAMTLGTLDLISDSYGVTSFDLSQPGRIRLRVDVAADSTGSAVDLFRGVRTQLNNAERASQPASGQAWVVLSMQASATSEVVEFPVKRGTVQPPTLTGGRNGSADAFSFGWIPGVFIELETLPYGLGEAIEYGPFTVTGEDPTFHIDGVPGDEPALAEFRITDNSSGVVVNRLRWACRSLPDMTDGQFDPVHSLATSGDADADTFNGFYESIVASTSWQTVGSVSQAASAYNGGLFDIWARVRDHSQLSATPTDVVTTASESISRRQFVTETDDNTISAAVSWSQATLTGSLLVLQVRIDNDTSITAPSGWVTAATATKTTSPTRKVQLFYKAGADSESGSVSVSFGGAADTIRLALSEYRGFPSSGVVDVTATNTVASSSTASTGTTAAMAQNYGLALAMHGGASSANITQSTSGWSTLYNDTRVLFAERVVTAGGTQSLTASISDGTGHWAALIVVFQPTETAAATMPAGSYNVKVTSLNASSVESASSESASVTLDATGAIDVDWIPTSTATSHRVYWKRDTEAWKYKATGSSSGTYTLTSETSATTADPPAEADSEAGEYRVRIGPESGTTYDFVSSPFSATVANSEWEPIYAGRTYLSPTGTPLIATQPGWNINLQAKAESNTQMDVDALVLMPADEQQMDVRYAPGDLSTARTWVVGTTPDLRSYGFLQDGSSNEAGRLLAVGRALVGPGDVTIVMIPTVEGGVWNVTDVSLSVTVHLRPVYMWLAGGV